MAGRRRTQVFPFENELCGTGRRGGNGDLGWGRSTRRSPWLNAIVSRACDAQWNRADVVGFASLAPTRFDRVAFVSWILRGSLTRGSFVIELCVASEACR